MKHSVFFCAAALAASAWAAAPAINPDSVTMSQSGTPLVTIRYRLTGGPAIVTVDIQTNVNRSATGPDSDWVSIGESNFRNVRGDVNLLIEPSADEDKVITWQVDDFLPAFKARNRSCRAVVRAWATDAPPDYMVVDLRRDGNRQATDPRVRYYVSTNAFPEAGNVQNDVYRTDYMAMRLIKSRGQTFRMGSPSDEDRRENNEDPHSVTFTDPDYYMAVYPLTIGQTLNIGYWVHGDPWGIEDIRLDGTGMDYTIYQNHSVDTSLVNSNHIALICGWSNLRGNSGDGNFDWPTDGHAVAPKSVCGQLRTRTGVAFDLPTEAQWEYCCRAGTTLSTYGYPHTSIAWFDGNTIDGHANMTARIVGCLQPNAWGLYDTLGTVFEHCLDWYSVSLGTEPVINPIGPVAAENAKGRVMRGGNYAYAWTYARAAYRLYNTDSIASQKSGGRLVAPVGLTWPTQADKRMLTAEYSLTADTIVTADVQTNRTGAATADAADWISIGDEYLTSVFGDVNCRVPAGEGKKIYWRADETWPGQLIADGAIRIVAKQWADSNPPDYLVIDLRANDNRGSTGSRERYYSSAKALPYGGITNRLYKHQFMAMRRIPAQGVKWCMGSPADEYPQIRWADGETQHYVTFTQEDFYCAVYPVTCGQLDLIGGIALSYWSIGWNDQYPDKSIVPYCPPAMQAWGQIRGSSGTDWPSDGHAVTADSYLGKLSALDGGRDFDLPTDAQWEFLCRAGTGTAWYTQSGTEAGWFDSNNQPVAIAREVGLLKGNAWGLYDLHGGMWELVLDWAGPMSADAVVDPYGPLTGSSRVWRGGNGSYAAAYGRSASRYDGALNYCCGLYGTFRPITPISGKWPNNGRVLPTED